MSYSDFETYKERFEALSCYKFASTGRSLPGTR